MSARLVPNQDELTAMHGTPEDYAWNVWTAFVNGKLTMEEADAAITKYHAVWSSAGKQKATPVIV